LIGTNEIVHVDQSGKSFAVAVNEFARQESRFPMSDQSKLSMKLEGCHVEPVSERGELLMVLQSGALALLSFATEGRTVNSIRIQKVPSFSVPAGVACVGSLGRGRLFLGNEDNNSVVLGWTRTGGGAQTEAPAGDVSEEEEEDLDDEDDLYGGGGQLQRSTSRQAAEPLDADTLAFRVHDVLPNYAPIGEITFGNAGPGEAERQMVYPIGRESQGGLAVCRRQIDPLVRKEQEFPGASAVFAFHASASGAEAALSADAAFDQYLLVSLGEESVLYSIAKAKSSKIDKGEFEAEGGTVEVGVMGGGSSVVQVKSVEIRCYNSGECAAL
jgi:cleavage and polyadenylation specificity factor subunit 1